MSRRFDVELTSARDDGTWTWRAAGARQPKGLVAAALLPPNSEVGDVVRAEVDSGLDGLSVTAVLAPKETRAEPERLELLSRAQPDQLVTTVLAKGGRERSNRERRDGDDDRGAGPGSRRPRTAGSERRPSGEGPSDRPRERRGEGPRREGTDRLRPRREPEPKPARSERRPARRDPAATDDRPRPKRLRPGRVHRKAVLGSLPGEQQVIADQVLQGGIPAVRQAVAKQNDQARADGRPEVKAEPLVAIAEDLLPRLRTAEWHDRADAALDAVDELDLRDLRSVVVAAEIAARTDETRDLAVRLREALARRVEQEQTAWLNDLASALSEGRTVRALKLSSRPPKAGAPLPVELSDRLVAAATAALTADDGPDRWATVLDALQFAPVHQRVEPASVPDTPSDALLAVVRKTASRLPQIAARFGMETAGGAAAAGTRPPRSRRSGRAAAGPAPTGSSGPKPVPPPPTTPPAASIEPSPPLEPSEPSEPSEASLPAGPEPPAPA